VLIQALYLLFDRDAQAQLVPLGRALTPGRRDFHENILGRYVAHRAASSGVLRRYFS
jgi:hypothetical protein